jgi:hypothetical protein
MVRSWPDVPSLFHTSQDLHNWRRSRRVLDCVLIGSRKLTIAAQPGNGPSEVQPWMTGGSTAPVFLPRPSVSKKPAPSPISAAARNEASPEITWSKLPMARCGSLPRTSSRTSMWSSKPPASPWPGPPPRASALPGCKIAICTIYCGLILTCTISRYIVRWSPDNWLLTTGD